MTATPPPKSYALACWWLTYRVPVEHEIMPWVEHAHRRAAMTHAQFSVCQVQWPRAWERMLAKRAVRMAYLRERGVCPPDGWAPLPGDRRSLNVPLLAQKRQFSASLKRYAAMGR